jgi:hypothetical protein
MLDIKALRSTLTFLVPQSMDEHGELDRLLAAAVVNSQFCARLLEDPAGAVKAGLQGESFHLSEEEAAVLYSIEAATLAELAEGLAQFFRERPVFSMPMTAPSVDSYGR